MLNTVSPVMFLNGITAMEISPLFACALFSPKILGYSRTSTTPIRRTIITSLNLSIKRAASSASPDCAASSTEPVFTTPWGVMSKTQESTKATGNPTIRSTITRVTDQSGSPSLGNIISAASIMIKAVAAYMARTLGTPRRLSSFQNPDLLFDIYAMDGFSAIYNLKAKKSNRAFYMEYKLR